MDNQGEENFTAPQGEPYKVVDHTREKRFGIVATDLCDFINRACVKLNIPPGTNVKVALEQDGTEVEDEDYFSTLESNTALMMLVGDQKWIPAGKYSNYRIIVDETDGDSTSPKHLQKLVDKLNSDLTCITLLGGKELELLADMDPESVADLFPGEKGFLESLKEASSRFLSEKQQAKDAMDLLKLYHCRHVSSKKGEKTSV